MLLSTSPIRRSHFSVLTLILAGVAVFAFSTLAFSQATISTGSVQGAVLDASGALVAGAKVTITNKATAESRTQTTTSGGTYGFAALLPGDYTLRVEAKGFKTAELPVKVTVGVVSPASVRLQVGPENQVVNVEAEAVLVNTVQSTIQGVLTTEQIERLPINGRNFLDLAQLEPGVQIQDGINFDPTKGGYSSISFGGRFGRSARIEVDGLDVSDETVGTTTQDIPQSAIQEFQLGQSSLDLSTELTSSGAVNVVTRSGSNHFHGEAFYLFRDSAAAAKLPTPPGLDAPFQRHQFGGRFGGPIIKDKLFFFIDGERTKQDLRAPVSQPDPFSAFSGGFQDPFRETETIDRLDYNLTKSARLFYRFSYFQNSLFATFFPSSFQVYANKNYTRSHALGLDFTTGRFTHSIRFEYLKFQNEISDVTIGSTLPLANLGVSLFIGNLATGPNLLAPQSTPQSNHQVKYDGAWTRGRHILRYGVSFNHIQGGGFAKFFGLTPNDFTDPGPLEQEFALDSCDPAGHPFGGLVDGNTAGLQPCFPGGINEPLNYPVEFVLIGNGQGFSTEHPAFGLPAGGLGPDNRLGLYIGDTWKLKPNLTLNFGLRYVRDTGRTDSDLPAVPELNALFPGLGNRVRQDNNNFAPQAGFAWDPWKNGKTVIRAGGGLFYENVIYNNVLFDRPPRLAAGAFLQFPPACFGPGLPNTVATAGGPLTPGPGVCGDAAGNPIAIGMAAPNIAAFQSLYQSLNPFNLSTPNPNYIPSLLAAGISLPTGLFAPNYRTPYSIQMNAGIEREIRKGMKISADYVRNVTVHSLLTVDVNHVGDSRFFDVAAAQTAVATANNSFGCGLSFAQAATTCAIGAGATMADYAGNGLTSASDFGGSCPAVAGLACAFPGVNPAAGQVPLLFPIGRSVYNALQVKLIQDLKNPVRGVKRLNLQVSYSLSRFTNNGGRSFNNNATPGEADQDFITTALDFRDPLRFSGPSLLDRTHQISFGGIVDFPASFSVSFVSHYYTPLPLPLLVPSSGLAGDIFRTDFTGDGSVQDLVPGTANGSFGRGISASGLNAVLTNYNNTVANQATPAGQALIGSGLFTLAQLQALGGVAPTVPLAPSGQVGLGAVRAFDLKIAWSHTFNEKVKIEPSMGIYNLFNFSNFDLPPGTLSGLLVGGPGFVNGTTRKDRISNRVGVGTGVFGLGSPRTFEFGLKLSF